MRVLVRYASVLLIVSMVVGFSGCGGGAQSAPSTPTGPAPLKIETATVSNTVINGSYSLTLTVSGGTAPYTWTLASGNLPPGLTLSPAGQISGTATTPGSYVFTLQVKDASGQTLTRQYTLTVSSITLSIDTTSLPTATIGTAFNQNLNASGGTGTLTFSVASGTLPPGITLSAAGNLSGTPTAVGSFSFSVQVTDSASQTVARQFQLVVNATALQLLTQSVPSGTVGTPYSTTLSASGGSTPYTWAISSGSLPAGLSLSAAGVISGTPAAFGASTFTARVTDASNQSLSRQFTLTVNATQLAITTQTLASGTVGVAYNATIATTGGAAPFNFTLSGGTLPAGITLSSAGVLSGTPTAVGTSSFTVGVTDGSAQNVSKQFSIAVNAPTLSVATQNVPNATVNTAYSTTLAPTGGVAPYNWSVSAGALPAGVTLSTAGLLSGTPTAVGAFNFTAQVTDSSAQSASRQFTLTVGATQLTITTSVLAAGTIGSPYSATIAAAGGLTPYTFSVSGGALPAGLALSSGGALTGTPTALGTSNFTVNVTDGSAQSVSQQFSLTINATTLSVATQNIPGVTVNTPYSTTLAANGGVAPYNWTVSSGTLPTGVTLASNGTLSGTPTQVGTFSFTAQVSDGSAQSAIRQFTLAVNATQLSITTTTLADGAFGVAYNATIATSGGLGPFNFTVSAGALPAGLSLSTTGTISGTPSALGIANFTVNVTDASAQSVSQQFSITINATTLSVATQNVPGATVNTAYSTTLAASGGAPAYNWTVTAGSLPAGVTLATNGTLSGTPTVVGSFSFTAQVTDGSAQSANRQFTLTVSAPQLSITTSVLADGTLNSAYSATIATSGGLAPFNFTVSAGALPAGLTLSTGGVLSGTPTALGSSSFTVNVTDASAQSVSQQFSLTINPPALSVATQNIPSVTVNTAYSTTLTPNGGVGPYSWTVSAGSLPAGVTLATNGTLSGTPTAVGTFTFTALVTDSAAQSANRQFTLTVNATQLQIVTNSLVDGVQGTAYADSLSVTGGLAPFTFSVASGTLPTGVSLSSAGAFSGTPTVIGTFTFTVAVDDASAQHVLRQYQIVIQPTSLKLDTLSVPDAVNGNAYSTTLAASGGVPAYTWSIPAGSLPTGLSLNPATGQISGTPTVNGAFTFTAQVADNSAQTQSRQFTITVNPSTLVISTLTLPDGTLSVAYSQTITASGGTPGFTFSIQSGTVPTGLTLSAGGVLSGTPTAIGQFSFVVQVDDSAAQTATRAFTVTINPSALQITTQSLPDTIVGASYSQTLASTGGVAPFTWSVTAGAVPTGLTLSSGGALTGTPSAAGTFTFTARVADGSSQQASRQYSIVVAPPPLSLDTVSLPNATVSTAYTTTLSASGGTPPYSWSVTAGTLPTGITLNGGTGVISGTASTNGTATITIRVQDAAGTPQSATRQFNLTVNPQPLQITTQTLPSGTTGTAYSQTLASTGGVAPFTWTVTAGSVPTGLSLSTGGALTGTPTAVGSFTFTAQVADTSAQQASRQYTVQISPPPLSLDTLSLPAGTVGSAYSTTLAASGGTPTYSWSITAGTLPTGLSLNPGTGAITGTPTVNGTSSVTIRVQDSAGTPQSATRQFSLTINPQPLQISTQTLPAGTAGTAYSQTLASTGGVAPFTWTVTAGTLPTGLSLSTAGAITGTPSAAGTFTFTARVADTSAQQASRQFSIQIAPPPLVLNTLSLPAGTVGTAYSTTLSASGGTPAYTWSITAGALPTGLTLNAGTGAITGTPTVNGTSSVTIRVQDAAGTPQSATRQFSLTINPQPLQISTQTLPAGTAGTAYSQTLASTGGVAPFTWTVTAGTLPTGLSLSTAGAITGTPSAAGSFTFTAQVADNSAQQASRQYTVQISPPTLVLNTLSLPSGQVSVAYSTTLAASGGTPPYTWSITAGALPAGLTLNAGTGAITGTPTANGTSSVTIRVQDAAGTPQSATRQFSLTINPPPLQITTQTIADGVVGTAYSQTLASSGGLAPFTWTVTAGTLPTGLSLSTAGAITGTPSAAGTFTFTARVADSSAQQASRQYTVQIAPPPLVLNTLSLPTGTTGVAYSTTLSASGGTPPYTWAVTAGTLPTGITLNASTGVLSGTASTASSSNITIRVQDAAGTPQQASRQFTLAINTPPLTITTQTVPDTVLNAAYSQTLAASGGLAPYTWSITVGALPTGLTMSTGGAITGTATASGTFTFTARVADNSAQQASRQYTINVSSTPLTLDTVSLPNATLNTGYNSTLSASGGLPGYTWDIVAGTLPTGLSLSSAGSITGTPTVAGTSSVTIRVRDTANQSAQRQFSLTVAPPPLNITTTTLPLVSVGQSFTFTLQGTGGVPPYTWTVTSGALPGGVTLSTAGVLSGTPAAVGQYSARFTLTDSTNATTNRDLTLNVTPVFRVTTPMLWGGIQGSPYSQFVQSADGQDPITWSISAGTLPTGLTINSTTGEVGGTPTAPGTFTFTVRAADSAARTATKAYTVIVSPNDANYGNVGDAYATEGGAPNPSATLISSCVGQLNGNTSYRVTQNISAATSSAVCLRMAVGTKLDLGTRTVTGRIVMNDLGNGVALFNGTVNCNFVDNGGDAGCVWFAAEGSAAAGIRAHHLTITNQAQFSRALHIDWPSTNPAPATSIRLYNITATVLTQPLADRSFALSVIGSNQRVEAYSNNLTCVASARACQGIMCFGNLDCKMHHNQITMTQNTTDETGRAMLFDGDTLDGEAWNNLINANNNRGLRIRDSFNIRVHHNIFNNITDQSGLATIHLGDPDGAAVNDLNAQVDHNTFNANGGQIVFIRGAINAFVENNRVTCTAACANSSFAAVRASTRTELTLRNNQDVILVWPPPQHFVESGAKLFVCNSGSSFGAGTTTVINPCPPPQ